MTLRTLNYGNYGIFLNMGNAGFCPSTVVSALKPLDFDGVSQPSTPAPVLARLRRFS